MNRTQHLAVAAWLCGADLVALVLLRPDFGHLGRELAAPRSWLARDGADGAVAQGAAAALWLVAAWLGVGLLVTAASRLPGQAARLAGLICVAVVPRVLRRVLVGSAGLGVLLAPAAAGAAGAHGGAGLHPTTAVTHAISGVPSVGEVSVPRWPTDTPTGSSAPPATPPTATSGPPPSSRPSSPPTPTAVSGPPPSSVRSLPTPRWPSASRSAEPTPPAKTPTPRSSTGTPAAQPTGSRRTPSVTVHVGDSLWMIAARRLGAHPTDEQVAAYWPDWYAANRTVIGDDPNVITPGQELRVPAAHAEESRS